LVVGVISVLLCGRRRNESGDLSRDSGIIVSPTLLNDTLVPPTRTVSLFSGLVVPGFAVLASHFDNVPSRRLVFRPFSVSSRCSSCFWCVFQSIFCCSSTVRFLFCSRHGGGEETGNVWCALSILCGCNSSSVRRPILPRLAIVYSFILSLCGKFDTLHCS
jgi:hypothetical protein